MIVYCLLQKRRSIHRHVEISAGTYHISLNYGQGANFFFRTKRGRILEGGDFFKHCQLEVVPYFVLFSHNNKKKDHIK